jgi:hypothetical protein
MPYLEIVYLFGKPRTGVRKQARLCGGRTRGNSEAQWRRMSSLGRNKSWPLNEGCRIMHSSFNQQGRQNRRDLDIGMEQAQLLRVAMVIFGSQLRLVPIRRSNGVRSSMAMNNRTVGSTVIAVRGCMKMRKRRQHGSQQDCHGNLQSDYTPHAIDSARIASGSSTLTLDPSACLQGRVSEISSGTEPLFGSCGSSHFRRG